VILWVSATKGRIANGDYPLAKRAKP
jgi:hypothetical protein